MLSSLHQAIYSWSLAARIVPVLLILLAFLRGISLLVPLPSRSAPRLASVTQITVTTTSDAINGDCSSIAALLASPGPDGISLREAISASNNTPGPENINFAPVLTGCTILIGSATNEALPILLGGGLTIDGDIDGDGHPDITLDGSLGAVQDGPLVNGLNIWSDGNTIQHLRFSEFSSNAIQFTVPNPPEGTAKTISSNQILTNTIISSHVTGSAIGGGPFGLIPNPSMETVSNLTWQDIVIAGNQITGTGGIFFYAGTGYSHNNLIRSVTIRGNHLSGGGGIGLVAGDANTAYHHWPLPIQYADYNAITDVLIEGNILNGVNYNGILVSASNMGNRYNRVERVSILSNTVQAAQQIGISIGVGDGGIDDSRMTSYNQISQVEVRQNRVEDAGWGAIVVTAGGTIFVDGGAGGTDNTLMGLIIANNRIYRAGNRGIAVFGGVMEHTGGLVAYNLVQDIQITGNQVLTQTNGGAAGIELVGGWRSAWAQSGEVRGNRVEMVSLRDNQVSGFDTGLVLLGGDGFQVTGNAVTGMGCGNILVSNLKPLVQADNRNGANNNILNWQWPCVTYLPLVTR